MKSKEQIFAHIQESAPLPSLPHILVKLIDLCDDEEAPVVDIGPLVAQDMAMSSRVLRLVNSAHLGLNRTFSDLGQAVVYLGAGTIKNLAVTASVQQVFSSIKNSKNFNIGHFWYRSLLSASIGRSVAQATKSVNAEEAYLAGLLHNIGHLVAFNAFPDQYTEIQEKLGTGEDECSEEEKILGVTHCELGAWLLRSWKISPFIADAALYHHQSADYIEEGFPLVKITFLADIISETNGEGLVAHYGLARKLLGLSGEELQEITEGAKTEVFEIAEQLEVSIQVPNKNQTQRQETTKSAPEQKDTTEETELHLKANQLLIQQVENSSLLTSFCQNLIQANGKDSILAAAEEVIRVLFGSKTIFFLLYDSETDTLSGATSSENSNKDLIQGRTLPNSNRPSLAFRSLVSQRILTSGKNAGKEQKNLADIQLFNIVNAESIRYVPMLAKKEHIGVIVLGAQAGQSENITQQHKQMQLIADQTAIALHLDDLQRKETQRVQTERMATASLAARKVVHEVNNPLGIISNYLKILELKVPNKKEIQQELEILEEEIRRISTIIEQLNDFTTSSSSQAERLNVNELLEQMLRILDATLLKPARIQLITALDPSLAEITTDKDTLKQIVINLVKNAVEAMQDGGSITIRSAPITDNTRDKGVVIDIQDTGPGLPEKIKQNLFAPFMTTKSQGHSGLGLSVVHKATQDLGGTIQCESTKEDGTRFSLSLPLNFSKLSKAKETLP